VNDEPRPLGKGSGARNVDHAPTSASVPDDASQATRHAEKGALWWAGRGFPVFPCSADKRPLTPHGFKDASTDEATIRAWWAHHPGALIGMPTGEASGIAVLDIDMPFGPGSLTDLQAQHGDLPDTYTVRTQSGGTHHWFRTWPGAKNSASAIADGVDTRGEGGYVIVPPSPGYTVTSTVRPAEAPSWLRNLATRTAEAPAAPAPVKLSPERRAALRESAVERELDRLRACHGTPVGQPPHWDATTFEVACSLIELENAGVLDPGEADHLIMAEAPRDAGFTDSTVQTKLDSAHRKVGDKARDLGPGLLGSIFEPRPAEVPATVVGEGPNVGGRGDDGRSAGAIVAEILARYDLGVTLAGEPYVVPRNGVRRPVMLGSKGTRLKDEIKATHFDLTGKTLRTQAVEDAVSVVVSKARRSHPAALHLRAAYGAGKVQIDLGDPTNARTVVISAAGWYVADAPEDGVLFRLTPATRALPEPSRQGDLDALAPLLGWRADSREWLVVKGWQVASVFPDVPRPLLMFLGPAGSGKTTRAHLALNVLDPRSELGSSFGKNLTDDQVKAYGRYLIGYDNLGRISEAVSDHLCRLVTGDEIDKRELYTDLDQIVFNYRRTGAVTAIEMPTLKPDAWERFIPLTVGRFADGTRTTAAEIEAQFEALHPRLLGGLCDAVAGTLARLSSARRGMGELARMADFHVLLHAHSPAAADAYLQVVADATRDVAEADPFIETLVAWLESKGGHFHGPPIQAWQEAAVRRPHDIAGVDDAWWPKGARTFSAALTRHEGQLRSVGITVETGKSHGSRFIDMTLRSLP